MCGECQCLAEQQDAGLETLKALIDDVDKLLPQDEPYLIRAKALVAAGGEEPMRVLVAKWWQRRCCECSAQRTWPD